MKPSVNLLQYTLPSGFTIDIPDINSTLYIDVDQLSLCDDVLVDQDFIFRLLKYKGLDNNYYIFNSRFYEAFKYYLSKYSLASINNSNSVSSDGDIIDSKVVNSVLTRILKNTTTNVEAFEFTLFTVNNKDKYLTQYKLLVKFAIDGSLGDKAVMTFKKLGGTSSITISDDQPDQYNRTAIWIDTKRNTIHYWDGYRYTTPYASSIDLTIDNEVPVNPELADNGSVPSTKAVSLADQRLRNELSNLNLSVTSKLDDIDTNISNILLDLDKKVDKTSIGAINGVAGLDFTGKVPTSQLPDGIGEVISVNNKKGVVVLTKDDIGLNNVDNTSDVNKPISTLQKEALDTKVDKVPGKQLSTEDFTTALKKKLEELVPGGGVPDNILDLLNLKYDKSGGLISGDVQVNGLVEAKDDVVAYSNVRDIMLQASSGGSMYLYELLDVNITDPINGALLMYDSNSKMWINKNLTEDFTHIYNLIADKYDKTGGAITGNVQISDYLSVGERISGRLLSISEGATVNVLSVTTDASIGGNLNVSSGITCLTLDVKANAKVGLDLNVGDNVYAGKDVVAFSDKHDVLLLAEGGGATYLYELLDVDVTSVITGQYLKYDGTKWINSVISYTDISDLNNILNSKVDKVSGKELSSNDFTNAYKSKVDSIESGAQVNKVTSVAGKTGAVTLVKADVGLANVDNTSDANKPISTATQTALNGKLGKTETAADSSKLGGRPESGFPHQTDAFTGDLNSLATTTKDTRCLFGKLFNATNAPHNYHSFASVGSYNHLMQFNAFNGDLQFRTINENTIKGWFSIFHSGNSNLSTIDWNAKEFNASTAYSLISNSKTVAQIAVSADNGGYIELMGIDGVRGSIIRGYSSQEGYQAEFLKGGVKLSGRVRAGRFTASSNYLQFNREEDGTVINKDVHGFGIYHKEHAQSENDYLEFSAYNGDSTIRFADIMRVQANGKVGFGGANPLYGRVQILTVKGNGDAGFTMLANEGTTFRIYPLANDTYYIGRGSNAAAGMYIDKNGKIGINNNAPTRTLELDGESQFNISSLFGFRVKRSGNAGSFITYNPNNQINTGWIAGASTNENYEIHRVFNTNETIPRLVITPNGSVGLGIAPTCKLDVDGNVKIGSTAGEVHLAFRRGNFNYVQAPSGGSIGFITNGRAVGVANLTLGLYNDNTVGIGGMTTPPMAKLHVMCEAGKRSLRLQSSNVAGNSFGALIIAGTNVNDSTFKVLSATEAEYFHIRGDGQTSIAKNLIVRGEAVTYSQDAVQTTSVGMTREAYVPLSQFEAMEKRLSDQILLLQIEINKLKTN